MFTLVTERSRYLRVREGVTADEITARFSCPASGVFRGAIVKLSAAKRFCYAMAGDGYDKIAKRERVDVAELIKLNGGVQIYPTMRVWLP